MKKFWTLLLLSAAAILLAGAPAALAMEEENLIAPDGTLYVVRAGTGAELGITDASVRPDDSVIAWSSLSQDGTLGFGLVPGAVGAFKHDIDLAFDEPTGSLVVLWTEEVPLVNLLRLGILRAGHWTVSDLLPTNGFPHVRNPRMLLSHSVVHTTDADGKDVASTRSMLSVMWWEESNVSQARFASIFLDEDSTASQVQVYDLPTTIGSTGKISGASDHPQGAYMYPSLQLDGIEGALLASFADLGADKQYVVRITFPGNLGKPGPDNVTWQRRRIPIVGVASEAPISNSVPGRVERVTTMIGASYHPTIVWRSESAVGFTRFDGKAWSSARTIPLDSSMTYDRALRLVQEMATRN